MKQMFHYTPIIKFRMIKLLRFYPVLILVTVTSCTPSPQYFKYSNIVIPIREKIIPETAPINVPLSIYAYASAPDGCWSNIHFVFEQTDEKAYELIALADYESKGACPEVLVTGDTVLTFTPVRPGNHIITIWKSSTTFDLDTIKVGEFLPYK